MVKSPFGKHTKIDSPVPEEAKILHRPEYITQEVMDLFSKINLPDTSKEFFAPSLKGNHLISLTHEQSVMLGSAISRKVEEEWRLLPIKKCAALHASSDEFKEIYEKYWIHNSEILNSKLNMAMNVDKIVLNMGDPAYYGELIKVDPSYVQEDAKLMHAGLLPGNYQLSERLMPNHLGESTFASTWEITGKNHLFIGNPSERRDNMIPVYYKKT